MVKEKKVEAVNQLAELLRGSKIVIAVDYRGLSVSEMNQLRRQLRELGIKYRVVKNSLARFAGEKAGKPGLSAILEGPTALAFGYGDVVEPARALAQYIRSSKISLSIRGGLLDGRVLSASEVFALSTLPPKDALIATLLARLQQPVFSLVNVLSANVRGLLGVLNARAKQLEGG